MDSPDATGRTMAARRRHQGRRNRCPGVGAEAVVGPALRRLRVLSRRGEALRCGVRRTSPAFSREGKEQSPMSTATGPNQIVTSVIQHQVKAGEEDRYEAWLRE